MADFDDTVIEKPNDLVQISVLCDRCDAQLVVEARSREAAREKLKALIIEKRWRVVDRLEGAESFGEASTAVSAHDLCNACATQL